MNGAAQAPQSRAAADRSARPGGSRCPRPDLPGLQLEARRVVRRDRREQPHEGPADNAAALLALHLQSGAVRSLLCGAGAGALVAALIIAAGPTATAWFAIALAAALIVAGAIDYVRSH